MSGARQARPRQNGVFGLVAIMLATACCVHAGQADYKYINCFKDVATNQDLSGSFINYESGTFKIDSCAGECLKQGYPYFGIQAQTKCLCDDDYGKHGVTTTCTLVCNQNTKCGGESSNDIYYTPKKDSALTTPRVNVVYTSPLSFTAARRQCVKSNGDLVTVTSNTELNAIKALLASEGITSGKMWQGIWKLNDNDYSWVNPTQTASLTRSNSFWVSGETFANPCVVMNVATGKWETSSCGVTNVFVCDQAPVPAADPTADTEASTAATDEEESGGFDTTYLSLAVVLPIFGLCYGGSCVLYCAHKIYKSFKRKKRQKMLLSRYEDMQDGTVTPPTEYEPHNKPKYENRPGSGRPFSAGKRATVYPIMAAPMQNGYFASQAPLPQPEERTIKTPVEDIKIPSPRGEPEGQTDVVKTEDERPDTTRDVQIDMNSEPSPGPSPPPTVVSASAIGTAAVAVDAMRRPPDRGTQSAKTKTEIRREKLLKKALQEARQRRRAEGTPVPGDGPPTNPPTPNENNWAQPSGRKPSPKYDDETDSGDSTVNLLDDLDRGRSADMSRDPTTMSIQEILRMKVSMRSGNRRKPKKILSA